MDHYNATKACEALNLDSCIGVVLHLANQCLAKQRPLSSSSSSHASSFLGISLGLLSWALYAGFMAICYRALPPPMHSELIYICLAGTLTIRCEISVLVLKMVLTFVSDVDVKGLWRRTYILTVCTTHYSPLAARHATAATTCISSTATASSLVFPGLQLV